MLFFLKPSYDARVPVYEQNADALVKRKPIKEPHEFMEELDCSPTVAMQLWERLQRKRQWEYEEILILRLML